MHTNHSHDCATPVEVLLETAKVQGLGAIAVTDHNLVSGAHAAAEIADDYGVKIIIGEEVKTKDQGEVIGLFIEEQIPKGVTLQEAIADVKRQGGLVYVPHPFDRMHSVPDYKHLLDVLEDIDLIEVFNPRVAFSAFNDEAARFAAKYRIVAGAGSDSHVAQAPGSAHQHVRLRRPRGARVAARGRHRPQSEQPRLRPGDEVPADERRRQEQGAAEAPRAARRRRHRS